MVARPKKDQLKTLLEIVRRVIPEERITHGYWDTVLDVVGVRGDVTPEERIRLFEMVLARFPDDAQLRECETYLTLVCDLWYKTSRDLLRYTVVRQVEEYRRKEGTIPRRLGRWFRSLVPVR